jgi:allophanate hydrolase subunit 2
MHEGVPEGGPLAPDGMERANWAASNAPGEATLEIVGSIVLRVASGTTLGLDDGTREVADGERSVEVVSEGGQVRYVALRGGLDVPVVLGGRGTLLVAGVGGHEGRGLRSGDVLRSRRAPVHDVGARPDGLDPTAPLPIVLGPDLDRFQARAIAVLTTATFLVGARRDRTGMRLGGPPLLRVDGDDTRASAPMIRGAMQVLPSGEAIVLGPDHPTTGGYPVIAALTRASAGALGARPAGAPVRFALRDDLPSGQRWA